MKTGLFAVFNSQQSKVQSFPVLVQSSCGLFALLRLDFQTLLTTGWDHPWLTVRLVTVCTASAFLHQWVDFIPSSMWSNCLWLLWTPSLADGWLCLHFRKLWTGKKSGWWRKSWIVGWSTGNCVTWSSGRVLVLSTTPGNLGIMFMHQN